MTSSVGALSVDCHDPIAVGRFWAEVLGGRLEEDAGLPAAQVNHAGTPLVFLQVPDDKVVKNRLHLDLRPERPRDEEVQRLAGLGARVVDDRTRPDGTGWVVMADPEGNEFCVERSAAERGLPTPHSTGEREMPPIRTVDERTMLTGMLDWYREGVLRKVDALDQDGATQSPLRSGTTIAGLVKHLALVEDHWFTHGIGQQPMPEPWESAPFDDDPDWEFHSAAEEPLADSVALYVQACERSRATTARLDLDHTATDQRGRDFTLRYVLLHMVEETARHLGHLDLLRELADGTTGE